MRLHRLCSLAAGCALLLSGTPVVAQQSDAPTKDEYLILGSPNRGAGEPIVSVNPMDPNNVIVAAMATLNRLPTGEVPIPRGQPGTTELRVKELSTPDGSRTDIAVTHDGGRTWTVTEDDFRRIYKKNRCSDSFSGAGPDGTLYVGCLAYLNRGAADYDQGYAPNGEARNMHGGSAIAWSKDKGKTWSQPVWVHPDHAPQLYPPTVHPVFEQASPWDRPMFVADAKTGTIYLSGTGPTYTVDPATVERPKVDPSVPGMGYTGYPPPSVSRTRTYLRASRDQGKTWGVIYPIDSDEYPGGRGSFSAAHGVLAVAYSATAVPAALQQTCPCTVFGISRDEGKSYTYSLIPPLPGPPDTGPGAMFRGGAMLGADPSKAGRFAIARHVGTKMLVQFSDDYGKTWSEPVVAAELPEGANFGHRAMKFAQTGELALIWKAMRTDRSYDVWSSLSRDAGKTFHTVRVSSAMSPPIKSDRGNFMFGDDLSSVDVDAHNVFVVWGDNRSGFLGTWFARIDTRLYQ